MGIIRFKDCILILSLYYSITGIYHTLLTRQWVIDSTQTTLFFYLIRFLVFSFILFPLFFQGRMERLRLTNVHFPVLNMRQTIVLIFVILGSCVLLQLEQLFPQTSQSIRLYSLTNEIQGAFALGPVFTSISFFCMTITPAAIEEIMFRGVIQTYLDERYRPIISITITALLFVLFHFDLAKFLSLFASGILLGTIRYITRNLWLCMIVHAGTNLTPWLAQLMLFLKQN